jgi:ferredoxin-NADP reductase
VFSRWLFERAEVGQSLRISRPTGTFCLPQENTGAVVCLTGGIGITPALCMVRALAAAPRALRFHLEHSVTKDEDAICREELEAFTGRNPSISIRVRCTRQEGRFGRPEIYRMLAESPDALFFLCGSERFLAGTLATLKACGVPPENVRTEAFTVAGEKPPASGDPSPPVCPVAIMQPPRTNPGLPATRPWRYCASITRRSALPPFSRQGCCKWRMSFRRLALTPRPRRN